MSRLGRLHRQRAAPGSGGLLRDEIVAGAASAMEALLAQGVAYVRFARQNPELYRIATMTNGRPGSDVETAVTGSAFARLRAAVQALIDAGGYAPVDAATAALELWSAVHGVASLQIAEPQLPFGDIEALTTTVLRAICLGRRAAAPTDDVATT